MNNTTEDVIILQMSTINDSHISCHFGPFFALLPLLTTRKIKLKKTPGDIII